jgi:hypothetical protein
MAASEVETAIAGAIRNPVVSRAMHRPHPVRRRHCNKADQPSGRNKKPKQCGIGNTALWFACLSGGVGRGFHDVVHR